MKKIVSEKIEVLDLRKQELMYIYRNYDRQLSYLIIDNENGIYTKESFEILKERIIVNQIIIDLEIYFLNGLIIKLKEKFGV